MQLILINTVDLKPGHHGLNDGHDPLAEVAVQGVVAAERRDAGFIEIVFNLEVRRAHFDKGLSVIGTGDHTTVVISE